MALTRNFLKSLQLSDEQVAAVIESHVETVDALKAINADLQSKLDESAPIAQRAADIEAKYSAVLSEYETYKSDVAAKDARRTRESAYRDALRAAGVADKRLDTIVRYDSDMIDTLEINDDGTIKNADEIGQRITNSWGDFITQTKKIPGSPVETPPPPAPATFSMEDVRGMSAAEINANWSAIQNTLKGN